MLHIQAIVMHYIIIGAITLILPTKDNCVPVCGSKIITSVFFPSLLLHKLADIQ